MTSPSDDVDLGEAIALLLELMFLPVGERSEPSDSTDADHGATETPSPQMEGTQL